MITKIITITFKIVIVATVSIIYLFIYSFIHSFIYVFIYLFSYLFSIYIFLFSSKEGGGTLTKIRFCKPF